MCLTVCIGSNVPLATREFSEAAPDFNVRTLEPREESVRGVLPFPHVYSLGAHTSCACGFSAEEEEDGPDLRSSRAALASYVAEAARLGEVALYVCWNGDAEPPSESFELAPPDLASMDEWLAPGSYVRVT